MGWVLRHSPLTGVAYTVHLCLADSVNDQNGMEFWMSQANLAAKARTTRTTVNAVLRSLEEHQPPLLRRLGADARSGTVRYRFLMPDLDPAWTHTRSTGVVPDDRGVSAQPTGGVAVDDRGCRPGRQGVSFQPTLTQEEPKKPKKNRSGVTPKREPNHPDADRLARQEWDRRDAKPMVGFLAVRQQIDRALKAGHTVAKLERVLPTVTVWSDNALDLALNGKQQAQPVARRHVERTTEGRIRA